jgi:hypothetical protein
MYYQYINNVLNATNVVTSLILRNHLRIRFVNVLVWWQSNKFIIYVYLIIQITTLSFHNYSAF